MGTAEPLLNVCDGTYGPFYRWLENLGLGEFLRRYPVENLVSWGWLVPQYTVRFRRDFFTAWKHYPSYPWGGSEEDADKFRLDHILWDSDWFIDSENEQLWFLHPFFRPDDAGAQALRAASTGEQPSGDTFTLDNGLAVRPIAHFFFHWQAYALIDVIRHADCTFPLFNTPTLEEEAASIAGTVRIMKEIDPTDILRMPQRWGKHAAPMTWLSHYRALEGALTTLRLNGDQEYEVRCRGARSLATYLHITAEDLESAIKDSFLVLASQWNWSNELRSKWVRRAWRELQRDVLRSVQWLCILNGRTLDFYLDKWRYNHFGEADWKELRKVLPVGSFSARDDFIKLAPIYLKKHNEVVAHNEAFTEESLRALVDRLRSTNYPFGSLLHAFRELHEALTYKSSDLEKLDLRERRPLDYYLLMAIRVEGVLRYTLENEGVLSSLKESELSLRGYIIRRATQLGFSEQALEYFSESEKRYTKLRSAPPEPVTEIMNLKSSLDSREHYLVQAFLCSILARNYFAHHYYLDGDLIHSKESGFMLGGILVTALTLA